MSERLSTFLRSFALGAAVGTAVGLTSYVCAFFNIRAEFDRYKNNDLRSDFVTIRQVLEEAKETLGRYPARLEDLDPTQVAELRRATSGVLVDPWQNPLVYRSDGSSYTLMSLGHDGRPGGVGIDADRDSSPTSPVPVPTFWQFTFDLPSAGLRGNCVMLGVVVLLTSITQRIGAPENRTVAFIGMPILFAMMVGMASVMSVVHIPNGH